MPPNQMFDQYASSMTGGIYGTPESSYTGNPFNFNMNGMPGGEYANMAIPFIMPLLQNTMKQQGMLPAQFFPTQNFYDQLRAQQSYASRQMALQEASKTDAETYQQMFRGIATMTDTPWGLRQQQAAATMSQDIAGLAPILAQMAPELFDQIHGTRGSAVVLTQALNRTGSVSRDPVTGGRGVSGETTGLLATEIFRQLYGPGADLRDMRGLGAGQAGLLHEQLVQRGVAASSIGIMSDQDRVRALAQMDMDPVMLENMAKRAGVGVDVIKQTRSQLQAMDAGGPQADYSQLDSMTGMDDMMRSFDAQKISGRLKDMAGVVSAMRDVFGDMGRPDAPMREIIAGLEMLTQGGLATMSPAKMQSLVQETRMMAKQAGVSMDTVMGLTAQAAQMGDAFGLDRGYAMQNTQSTLIYGQALAEGGRLDIPTFGSLGRDRATLLHSRLVAAAAASPMANQMNAIMRLSDQGAVTERDAAGDLNNVGRFTQAVRTNQDTFDYIDPVTGVTTKRGTAMEYGEALKLLTQGGLSTAEATAAFRASHANQEYGQLYDTGNQIRQQQARVDGEKYLQVAIESPMMRAAAAVGGNPQEQLASRDIMARQVARHINSMKPEDWRDTEKRNASIAKAMQQSMADRIRSRGVTAGKDAATIDKEIQAALASLGPMDANGVSEGARKMAVEGWATFDQYMSKTGYTSAAGYKELQDENLKPIQVALANEAQTEAAIATAMSGLGTTPLARIADTVLDAKSSDSLEKIIGKVVGAMDVDELDKNNPIVQGFTAAQLDIQYAERVNGNLTAKGTKQRYRAAAALDAMRRGGGYTDRWLREQQGEFGLSTDMTQTTNLITAINQSALPDAEKERLKMMVLSVDSARDKTAQKLLDAVGRPTDLAMTLEDTVSTLDRADAADKAITALGGRPDDKAQLDTWRASEAYQNADRWANRFLSGSQSRAEQFLGSDKDMEHLGRGGLALIRGVEDKHQQLQRLADKAGVSMSQLLSGDVSPQHKALVAEARRLQGGLKKDWQEVQRRQAGKAPLGDQMMTAVEKELLDAEQEFRTMPGNSAQQAQAQAEQLADKLIGMGDASQRVNLKSGRDDIIAEIITGSRQLPLQRATAAREAALKMATRTGLLKEEDKDSVQAQREALQKLETANLSDEDRASLQELKKLYAPLTKIGTQDADTASEVAELVHQQFAVTKPIGGDAGQNDVAVNGVLTLRGLDKVMLQGTMTSDNVDGVPIITDGNDGPRMYG
jgi:hypothetical protein